MSSKKIVNIAFNFFKKSVHLFCMIGETMIEFKNVYLKYTKEYFALYDINFKISKGEAVALVGLKDSGKSSILRLITGLEEVAKGEIYVREIPVRKIDYSSDLSLGYIPYKGNFLDRKTVYDNMKYILKVRKVSPAEQEGLINKVLIDLNIEGLRDQKIHKLSLYEKYIVSIARLMLRKLDVLLVDNIFEELTDQENKKIISLIKKYFADTTLVVATSSETIAKSLAKRAIKLDHGSIVGEESYGKKKASL